LWIRTVWWKSPACDLIEHIGGTIPAPNARELMLKIPRHIIRLTMNSPQANDSIVILWATLRRNLILHQSASGSVTLNATSMQGRPERHTLKFSAPHDLVRPLASSLRTGSIAVASLHSGGWHRIHKVLDRLDAIDESCSSPL